MLSLVCTTLVATVIVEIGGLSQTSGFIILAGICLLGRRCNVARRPGRGTQPAEA